MTYPLWLQPEAPDLDVGQIRVHSGLGLAPEAIKRKCSDDYLARKRRNWQANSAKINAARRAKAAAQGQPA